tara:strand:- start:171 stop:533 length:363 start_codon:yes stop_codon:yes gene_type:complete
MKTYEEAKTELLLKLKYLEGTIKFLKENSYFEKFCLNCRSIMKVPVNGERGTERKFCNDYCRRNYHYKNRLTAREKQIVHLRQQGKTLVEIGKQFNISKQAISVILQKVENKNEKRECIS